jgi:hypothetical protein
MPANYPREWRKYRILRNSWIVFFSRVTYLSLHKRRVPRSVAEAVQRSWARRPSRNALLTRCGLCQQQLPPLSMSSMPQRFFRKSWRQDAPFSKQVSTAACRSSPSPVAILIQSIEMGDWPVNHRNSWVLNQRATRANPQSPTPNLHCIHRPITMFH